MAEWNPDEPTPLWADRLKRSAESLTTHVSDLIKEIEQSQPFAGISRRIIDSTSLMEAVYWHDCMIEQLDMEIMALHASADDRRIYPISAMRVIQKSHRITVERLRELVSKGQRFAWP